eukprot:7183255-Prymnesium_polylepis.1
MPRGRFCQPPPARVWPRVIAGSRTDNMLGKLLRKQLPRSSFAHPIHCMWVPDLGLSLRARP